VKKQCIRITDIDTILLDVEHYQIPSTIFCVGKITKLGKQFAQPGDSDTSLRLHKTSTFYVKLT